MCAHSRISSGTKVDQLEELYKISWKTPTLTHITLVNTVRVYRVTSGNFFPPKLISKNFIFIFTLFSYSRSTKQKIIIQFGPKIRKLWRVKVDTMK